MFVHVRACMRRTYKDASLRGYLDEHVGVEGYVVCADTWMRTPICLHAGAYARASLYTCACVSARACTCACARSCARGRHHAHDHDHDHAHDHDPAHGRVCAREREREH